MPFPLAHPAAVLPLRRYCPRWLSLPALVMGSVIPDLAYLSPRGELSEFSHSPVTGTAFGVVGGLALLGLASMLVPPVARFLPEIYRNDFQREVHLTPRMLPSVVLSLMIGTWTHLLLDSVTHSHGWLADHWDVVRMPVLVIHERSVRVCHLLWYLCSFFGLVWLVWVVREWQQTQSSARRDSSGSHLLEAFVVALLVLPIEVLHYFFRSLPGLLVTAGLSLVLSVLVLARPLMKRKTARAPHSEGLYSARKDE